MNETTLIVEDEPEFAALLERWITQRSNDGHATELADTFAVYLVFVRRFAGWGERGWAVSWGFVSATSRQPRSLLLDLDQPAGEMAVIATWPPDGLTTRQYVSAQSVQTAGARRVRLAHAEGIHGRHQP